MEIKIQVRGIEKLQNYLKTVPRGAAKVAIKAMGEWLVGNDAHGLKHQPAYKYVSRKAAGYKTSAKQMRYFRDGQGRIFAEDLEILERQQRNLSHWPQRDLLKLNIDAGGVQARRILDRLVAAERALPAAA